MWAPRWRPRWAGDSTTRSECFADFASLLTFAKQAWPVQELASQRSTRSGAPVLMTLPAIEDDDAIGEAPRFVAIVGHVDDWHARARRGRARGTAGCGGAARTSTAASGSSSSSSSGADISARASATRCRSPPDSSPTRAIEQRLDFEHRRDRVERQLLPWPAARTARSGERSCAERARRPAARSRRGAGAAAG